jgi:hypothetical protein
MKTRRHINVPKPAIKAMLGVLNKALWWPVGSADQVEREFHDQFIDKNAKTFADLDLVPGDIANFTYAYLVSFLVLLSGRYEIINLISQSTNNPPSTTTAAHPTTTSLPCRRRRSARRRSTFTFWTTNREECREKASLLC